ncbi:beta-L-arabinofuranosidase domain-containing protein, partial [Mesorhizobium sp. M4B.F.Ca.ET.211.01.1.1]|uniref:beta-L-arabinofuranosidase domain-containing protein n=1 Tax=Mesorhizobium sp. M4B.F.Ca.ET.211.01.1.1 TaxID=2563954 RepID=UPI001FE000E8
RRRSSSPAHRCDAVIDLYGRLQQPDGYLSSWYQRIQPGLRWTNLRDCHELYCAGHLIEGAVAYFQGPLDETRRHRLPGREIHHVDGAGRDDLR